MGHASPLTIRGLERRREDESFVPVIVKRTDESRRHPDDVLRSAIDEGKEQLDRPLVSLSLSAVAGGLMLGFTAMAVAVVTVATVEIAPALQRLATALVYPLGFVICLMSGAELFTEHTATAVYPVLDRRSTVRRLLRLWAAVFVGNLVGAGVSAGFLAVADDVVSAHAGYIELGQHLIAFDFTALLTSAMMAGWLMALGGWLILATPPAVSQLASIYIVTFLIGLGDLHHSIAGAVELFTAMLVGADVSTAGALRFLSIALLGNLIGGVVFVAVLNYAHIRRTRTVRGPSGGIDGKTEPADSVDVSSPRPGDSARQQRR